MASQSNSITTTTNLANGYRKTATKLYPAFKDSVEEWSWQDDIDDEEITPSARENLIPLDVRAGIGAAMIPDGGYEARTATPVMNEGSFSFVHANARFFISVRANAFDQRARKQSIIRQIKYQSKKSLQALSRRVRLQFYGFSTGIVCKMSNVATATTMSCTLIDAFGVSTIDTAAYLSSMIDLNDGVCLVRSGALVDANSIGTVTAKPADGVIVVTWSGSITSAANDEIYFFNAVTDTTIAGSDLNLWPSGLLDITTSSSLHGLATSSEAAWAAAVNNTAGGRWGFLKTKALRQAIYNQGGGKLTDIVWSNGVENDTESGERAARIYDSAAMDLDGTVTAKGVKIRTSPMVPPGHVFGWDRSAWGKKLLTDKPDEDGELDFGSLYKAENRSGKYGGFDLIYAYICRSRAKFGRYGGLTES